MSAQSSSSKSKAKKGLLLVLARELNEDIGAR
jgi:hypothetical protein